DFDSLSTAFRLTGFFLHRHVYEPRVIEAATARDGFVQAALKALNPALRTLSGPNGISA
ncbi:DNA repair protein RecO, partial [Rhizobium ruizarguesonis]